MPWVLKETASWQSRARNRYHRWTYDHGPALTSLGIGAACAAAVLMALKVAGLLG